MSENNDEKLKENISKKVEHVIRFEGDKHEKEISQDEAEIMKSQLEAMALKAFEDKQKALVEKYGDRFADEIYSAESGYALDSLEAVLEKIKKPTKQKGAPTGKVGIDISGRGDEGYETGGELVDDIYDKLDYQRFAKIFKPKDYDPVEEKRLQKMADKLLTSLITGEKNRGEITKFNVWTCPECNATVSGTNKCPTCNKVYKDYWAKPIREKFVPRGKRR